MATVITVHGTNAGDESDQGDQWWQTGSDFQNRLCGYVDTPDGDLTIRPFHWSGTNSELERRQAGNDLRKECLALEQAGEDYVLVGHSHGGSVINHALFSAYAKGKSLPHLKGWMTVATPFIHFKRSMNFLVHVNFLGLITYLACFVYLVIFFGEFQLIGAELQRAVSDIGSISVQGRLDLVERFTNTTLPLALLFIINRMTVRASKRASQKHRKKFLEQYGDRWIALYDRNDEAITGLNAASKIRTAIVPFASVRKVIVSFWVLLALIYLGIGTLIRSAPDNNFIQLLPDELYTTVVTIDQAETNELQYSWAEDVAVASYEHGSIYLRDRTNGLFTRIQPTLEEARLGTQIMTAPEGNRLVVKEYFENSGSLYRLFDLDGQLLRSYRAQTARENDYTGALNASGEAFAYIDGQAVNIIDTQTGAWKAVSIRDDGKAPRMLNFSRDGDLLLVVTELSDSPTKISASTFMTLDGTVLYEWQTEGALPVPGLSYHQHILAYFDGGALTLVDLNAPSPVVLETPYADNIEDWPRSVKHMTFSPDDRYLIVQTDSQMHLYDVQEARYSGSIKGTLQTSYEVPGPRSASAFSDDGKRVAITYLSEEDDSFAGVLSLEEATLEWSKVMPRPVSDSVVRQYGASFSPDSQSLLVGRMMALEAIDHTYSPYFSLHRIFQDDAGLPDESFGFYARSYAIETILPFLLNDQGTLLYEAGGNASLFGLLGIPSEGNWRTGETMPLENPAQSERLPLPYWDALILRITGSPVGDVWDDDEIYSAQPLRFYEWPLIFLVESRELVNEALLSEGDRELADLVGEPKQDTTSLRSFLIRLLISVTWGFGSFFIFAGIAWIIGNLVAWIIFRPLVWILNNGLTGQLRSLAYGNDVYGESVVDSDPHVSNAGTFDWKPLPEELGQKIYDYTKRYAEETLDKVRRLLGMGFLSAKGVDIGSALSDHISWKEMIHTAYFDVDDFTRLTAVAIADTGMVQVSESLQAKKDFQTCLSWYEKIKPERNQATT